MEGGHVNMEKIVLTENERQAFEGFEKMMENDEKRWTPPICHMTPMFRDSSDHETWWECKHCGHTKSISDCIQDELHGRLR